MTDGDDYPTDAIPVHLMLREVWSAGDLALVDELVAEEHVQHDPVFSEPVRGRSALKEAIGRYRTGTPDLRMAVEAMYVDDGTVIARYTATGTHEGELLGVAPTGRPLTADGVYLSHVDDGKLVESTDMWDAFGVLRQIEAGAPGPRS